MKPAEKIERLLNDMNVTPDPEKDEQVLKAVLGAQVETRQHTPANLKPGIWRMIMHSKLTKLTIAAIFMVCIGIAIHLFDKTSSKVWAIEQSIDAMRDFRGIRLSCKVPTAVCLPVFNKLGIQDFTGNPDTQIEIWVRTDEAMSQSLDYKLVCPGKLVAVGGQERKKYVQLTNGTTYDAPSFNIGFHRWPSTMLSMLLEHIEDPREGEDTWAKLVGIDAETGKERLYLKGNSLDANQSFEFEFDVETKLLVSIKFWLNNTNHQGLPSGEIHKIVYYEDLPDRVFEIDLPSADQITPLNFP